jgi:hypothetical protein
VAGCFVSTSVLDRLVAWRISWGWQAEDLEEPARLPLRAVRVETAGCDGRVDVESAGQELGERLWSGFEDQMRFGRRFGREPELPVAHADVQGLLLETDLDREVDALGFGRAERAAEGDREGAGTEEVALLRLGRLPPNQLTHRDDDRQRRRPRWHARAAR